MSGRVSVRGPSPVSEIVLRDAHLRVLRTATSELTVDVDQGIYRLDVWTPGTTQRQHVTVVDGADVSLDCTGVPVDTVVPLADIVSADPRHSELAATLAGRPYRRDGAADADGALFLFARSAGEPRFGPPEVDVLDLSGRRLTSVREDGQVDALHGCAGLAVDLAEGHYVLRHRVPGLGTRGQILPVLAGRQTQLFAAWTPDHVDLGAAVVCMPALDVGFDPGDRGRYLRAEQALRALSTGRAQDPYDGDDPLLALIDEVVTAEHRSDAETGPRRSLPAWWVDGVLSGAPPESRQDMLGTMRTNGGVRPPLLAVTTEGLETPGARTSQDPRTDPLAGWVEGSPWARWDLDLAPLHREAGPARSRPGDPRADAAPHAPTPAPTPPPPTRSTSPDRRIALRLDVLGERGGDPLAAAASVVVRFGFGRHVDVGIWADDERADPAPAARVRVRIGVRALLYSMGGAPLRYDDEEVPVSPLDAIPLGVLEGELLLEHLSQHLAIAGEV